MYECKECGYKTENKQDSTCPVCNKPMEEIGEKKSKPKFKLSVKSILITFLAILIGRFAGSYFADMMMKDNKTEDVKSDMDSFVEQVEKYVPGKMTAGGYESDYWGIKFTPDEDWVAMDSYELAEVDRDMSATVTEAAVSTVKQEGLDAELVKKYEDTMFCKVEAGYYVVKDDMIVGELLIASYSGYTGDYSVDRLVEETLTEMENGMEDATRGKAYFDNKTYKYVDAVLVEEDGMTIRSRAYIKGEGVMINMIKLMYLEGYEEIVESFEDLVTQKY